MAREGDEQPEMTMVRRSVRYFRTPPAADPGDPQAVVTRLCRAVAERAITEGRCPAHPYRLLTSPALGISARGGGMCEDCGGFWSYSQRTGIVFVGPSPALPGYRPVPPLSERPVHTLGVYGFSPYLAAETINQLIDIAQRLDDTLFAEEDAIEAGKKILNLVEAGRKILIIAGVIALGRKLGYSR